MVAHHGCTAGLARVMIVVVLGSLGIISANAASTVKSEKTTIADEAVLQGIQISEKDTAIELQVDFAQTLQYLRHFPPNAGEILQIQLQAPVERPKDDTADAAGSSNANIKDSALATAKRESMLPPGNDLVPLVNVTYEGDVPGGPFLTLRFRYAVEYTVTGGPGGRSVVISVKKDAGGLKIRAGAEGDQASLSDQKLDEMMEEIRQALARDDHGRAIQLLSKLLQLPSNKHSQEAKELIGVAREKKGQIARAKLEYQEYLRLYTEGEGAERVKNRLASIDLAQVEPREKLKEVKPKSNAEIDTFGRFSQRYYQDITNTDTSGTSSRSSLTSFLNASSRYRDDEYDLRGFFNAHDVHPMQGGGKDEFEVNTAYVDIKNRLKKYSSVVGLQSTNKGGIFGRFIGAQGSYEFLPKYEITATVGKPKSFSSGDDVGDRTFYGTSLSVGSFVENWDGNAYYVQQDIEGIVDRQAVGGDVRYADKTYSMFASVDYDMSYQVLNLVFLRAGWKANEQTRIDVNYNIRQQPLIFTSSALQSEGYTKFKDLQAVASEAEIRDKVRSVSSLSRMLTVSAVYDIDQNNQINADITRSSIDGKPAVVLLRCLRPDPTDTATDAFCQGNTTIAASDKYGPDNSYSVQYIASNYFVERDIHIIGGRFSNGGGRAQTSLSLSSRFPYDEQWYIGPRIRLDTTQNDADNSKVTHPAASVKVDYRWKKTVSFEAELSYDIDKYSGGNNPNSSRTTIYFGYDVDF